MAGFYQREKSFEKVLTLVSMEIIMVSMETNVCRGQKNGIPPSGLEAHLGYLMRQVSNHVSGKFAQALRAHQTSVAEWVVLRHLQEHGGTSPSDLAKAITLTRGAISKVLAKLELKGWIAREVQANDNRVQVVSLTRSGRRIVPQLAEFADRNDEKQFHCLNESERAALRHMLEKLTDFHQIRDVAVE